MSADLRFSGRVVYIAFEKARLEQTSKAAHVVPHKTFRTFAEDVH